MQHGESRKNKPPYQVIKTNYKLLRSKMRWFSNSSTWNDPIDVTVKYNIEKDVELLDSNFDEYALKFAFMFINKYIDSLCNQKKLSLQICLNRFIIQYLVMKRN